MAAAWLKPSKKKHAAEAASARENVNNG